MARDRSIGVRAFDDRDRVVDVIGLTPGARVRATPSDLEEVNRVLGNTQTRRRILKRTVIAAIVMGTLAGGASLLSSSLNLNGWKQFAVLAIVPAIGLAITQLLHIPVKPLTARSVLGIGRCAQCVYEIAGLKPEQDGCVVCPECGAAWKMESIGKPLRGHA